MDFVGLDTETIKGYARLICLSDGTVFKINSKQDVICFFEDFSKQRFIAFNADFDIQAILKYFPGKVLEKLLKGISTSYGNKQMFYIKDKFLKFGSNHIFDCMQFFHTSLNKASKKYLNKEKEKFDVTNITEENIYSPQMIEYCIRDAKLAVELFEYFRESLPKSVKECNPYSSASYAQDYFREEIKSTLINTGINKIFHKAYRGGRFECLKKGHFKNVFLYDINSAYPYEICKLKNFSMKTKIKCIPKYMENADYSVYHLKVNLDRKYISPLIAQKGIGYVYPVGKFESWVTKGEYEILEDGEKEILYALHIFVDKEDQNIFPFKDKMLWLYSKKKTSNNREAYKVILNGTYGKLAQVILKWISLKRYESMLNRGKNVNVEDNYTDYEGNKYIQYVDSEKSNFLYAGEITARCRIKMFDVANSKPDKIIAIATDSLISEEKLDVPLSDKIGDWHFEKWDELYMIGCGVYFYRKKEKWFTKSRGFKNPVLLEGDFVKKRLDKILRSNLTKIPFQVTSKLTLSQARIQHTEWLANIIETGERYLDINMDKKRKWKDSWGSGKDISKFNINSKPLKLNKNIP